MNVTMQLLGIVAIALVGLLAYLAIWIFGLWFILWVGLALTVLGFVVVLALTAARDPSEV